ncbi:MAG: hypothetical protein RSF67_08710 [Clostridia bacterium]
MLKIVYLPDELNDFILYDETYSDRMKGCLIHFYNYLYTRHISCPIKRHFKSYRGICVNKNIVNFTYKQERIQGVRHHIYYEILDFLTTNNFIEVITTKNGKSFSIGNKSKHYSLTERGFKCVNQLDLNTLNPKIIKSFESIKEDVVFYSPNLEAKKYTKKIKLTKTETDINVLDINFKEKEITKIIENPIITRTCDILLDVYNNMIDRKGFEEYLKTVNKDRIEDKLRSVKSFKLNPYANISSKTGRLFSNLTNLSRDIREEFLNYKWSIDVKNAQFVFLCVLLKNDIKILDESTLKFIKLCSDGNIYEHMMEVLDKDRDYVKKWMYRLAFDSNLEKYEQRNTLGNKKLFRAEFPQVFNYMKTFKKDKGITIVTALQQIESDIFIDGLLDEFICDYSVLSLHDSIYCFDDRLDIKIVENKLIDICNSLNIYCNIHKIIKN